ncbi:hypothetical protein K0U83_23530 [bacterium]|nr:hypothetical protein [bacterium]
MAIDVSTAFIKQFESEVHMAYQRQGTKLRSTVRNKMVTNAKSTTFQKAGEGTATTKARHAEVAIMNVTHSNVECTLTDYFASDYSDVLDELKTNIDERQVLALSGAWALGRKTDELITDILDTTTNTVALGAAGMTKAKAFSAFETLGTNDVPDDGRRYGVVGIKQWTELLDITEFSSSDYVGSDVPLARGLVGKRWLGINWFPFSGLPVDGSSDRKCFVYHSSGVGFASGKDITTMIDYIPEKVSHLIMSCMSQGSVMIDDESVVEVLCDE